jgi:hypothetical protein
MKDLTNLLIKIYEGRFDRKEGESDEDYLNRVANQDMMTGSRQYVSQGKVKDYRGEGYDVDMGTDDTECIQAKGESDEDFLSRCSNRSFTPSARLFGRTPSDSVSKPVMLKPKP